ncbi:MAG: hypothetical protein MMC33_001969 [Icmadophila ericetorum]|nr:hypothetical protein [Icmadophila ericetorum]
MTTPQIVLEGSPASEDEWNEAQLATSLAHLQLLHTQLRELRETIPSLIKSVHADYLSPEGLYNEFAQSATTAVNNVKAFTKLMRDTETKAIMQRAEESRLQNAEGIMAWLVTQHDDWLDKSVEDNVRELRLTSEEVKDEDPGNGTNTEELRLLLKKFQDDHVEVEASLNEEDQKIEVIAC